MVFSSSLRLRLSFSFCRSLSFFSTSFARLFAFSRDFRTAMLLRSRRRRYSSVPLSRFFNECLRLCTRFLLSFWKLLKWAVEIRRKFYKFLCFLRNVAFISWMLFERTRNSKTVKLWFFDFVFENVIFFLNYSLWWMRWSGDNCKTGDTHYFFWLLKKGLSYSLP